MMPLSWHGLQNRTPYAAMRHWCHPYPRCSVPEDLSFDHLDTLGRIGPHVYHLPFQDTLIPWSRRWMWGLRFLFAALMILPILLRTVFRYGVLASATSLLPAQTLLPSSSQLLKGCVLHSAWMRTLRPMSLRQKRFFLRICRCHPAITCLQLVWRRKVRSRPGSRCQRSDDGSTPASSSS